MANYAQQYKQEHDALQARIDALGHSIECDCDECEQLGVRWDQLMCNPPCFVCDGAGCIQCNGTGVVLWRWLYPE
jgi:hypothetical protein